MNALQTSLFAWSVVALLFSVMNFIVYTREYVEAILFKHKENRAFSIVISLYTLSALYAPIVAIYKYF